MNADYYKKLDAIFFNNAYLRDMARESVNIELDIALIDDNRGDIQWNAGIFLKWPQPHRRD